MKMMTNIPAQKVTGSATGAGLAGAVVAVIVWLLGEYGGVEVPYDIQLALVVIAAAVGSFVAGYFTPPAARDQITEA